MSKEKLGQIKEVIEDKQRVLLSQSSYIRITKAGSDMFSVLLAGVLLGFYVDILDKDPTNYGTVLIIFAVYLNYPSLKQKLNFIHYNLRNPILSLQKFYMIFV